MKNFYETVPTSMQNTRVESSKKETNVKSFGRITMLTMLTRDIA